MDAILLQPCKHSIPRAAAPIAHANLAAERENWGARLQQPCARRRDDVQGTLPNQSSVKYLDECNGFRGKGWMARDMSAVGCQQSP